MADVRPEDIDTTVHIQGDVVGVTVVHEPSGTVGRALGSTGPNRKVSSLRLVEQARRHLVEKIKGDSV